MGLPDDDRDGSEVVNASGTRYPLSRQRPAIWGSDSLGWGMISDGLLAGGPRGE